MTIEYNKFLLTILDTRQFVSFVPQRKLLHFGDEELLQLVGTFKVFRLLRVVEPRVGEYSCHIGHKEAPGNVVPETFGY